MHRRIIVGGFLGLMSVSAVPCRAQTGTFGTLGDGQPSAPPGGARAPGSDGSVDRVDRSRRGSRHFNGCHLTRTGVQALHNGTYKLLDSCGIRQIDEAFAREINFSMIRLFGLSPACGFYRDDSAPNAFATPERLRGDGQGTIGFGITLMHSLLAKFSTGTWSTMGDHAAVAIFAHEFGHIAQFAGGFPRTDGKLPELHADYMAGWYTGIRALQLTGYQQVNFQVIARQMYDIGDFAFTDPAHHGTPHERVTAYMSGVLLASQTQGNASVQTAYREGRRLLEIR